MASQNEEARLLAKIQAKPLPRHIAIIMDGNGRWAQRRGLPRLFGHRAGTESVREIVRAAGDLGLEALTLYAFSTENWSRPRKEVNALMELLCRMLSGEVEELDKNGVRLRASGRISELPARVRRELTQAIRRLSHNRGGLVLNLALNYGGRQEIVDAANRLLKEGARRVDEKRFAEYLYTKGLSDPDLLIRTSGEQRISNFLLYQLAYAEFYMTRTLWPDFRKKEFYRAISDYQKRERRFGGT